MEKGLIIGKLERRISKKTGQPYNCIHVYTTNTKGEIKDITGRQPIYCDDDKTSLLNETYGIPLIDMTK